jgi:DNA-binding NarL/FixJ family response regulator
MRAGASAFVCKRAQLSELRDVIRLAAKRGTRENERTPGTRTTIESTGGFDPVLTTRQLQVLRELRTGASNCIIARTLGISENTVKHHLYAIFQAMGVSSRTEALVHCARYDWDGNDSRAA